MLRSIQMVVLGEIATLDGGGVVGSGGWWWRWYPGRKKLGVEYDGSCEGGLVLPGYGTSIGSFSTPLLRTKKQRRSDGIFAVITAKYR